MTGKRHSQIARVLLTLSVRSPSFHLIWGILTVRYFTLQSCTALMSALTLSSEGNPVVIDEDLEVFLFLRAHRLRLGRHESTLGLGHGQS